MVKPDENPESWQAYPSNRLPSYWIGSCHCCESGGKELVVNFLSASGPQFLSEEKRLKNKTNIAEWVEWNVSGFSVAMPLLQNTLRLICIQPN